MMDRVLRPKTVQGVLLYLDDVIIFGKELEEHNKHLDETLKLLKQYQLKRKPDKCYFGFREIKF